MTRGIDCPACRHGNPSDAKHCNQCGQLLSARSPAASAEGERKQVTVLFADVKGSMDLVRAMDVEQWWTIMQRCFALLSDGVRRFGGSVIQFTGDGLMAAFGAPAALEDHARRACHAALWAQRALADYAAELERQQQLTFAVRIGLNSGEVVAGTIGQDDHGQFTTIGHSAGLAQRMETLAEPGGVYLTQATARLARGFFALEERGTVDVRGAGPLTVFALTGEEQLQTPFEVARARGLTPFVGRARELTALEDALRGALAGQGQVVALVADAGVGKSRLCHEFLERCHAQGIAVLRAHALAHTGAVPFMPVLELLRGYFAIGPSDSAEQARERVRSRLREIGETRADMLAPLLDFLGVADARQAHAPVDPEALQRRLFTAVNRVLAASARLAPGVIFVEDLHWIDAGSAAFLENLISGVPGTRTLVLTTQRPHQRPRWTSMAHCRELRLGPLDRDTSGLLLGEMLGADPSLDGLAELIYEHADGNPFFVEEIVQTLVENGSLRGERGAYQLTRTIDEVQLPDTVEAILAARIDRLGADQKAVLQMAAVIGHQFSRAVLERTAGLSAAELDAALAGLLAAELVLPAQAPGDYVHRHALAERVAYRSQLASARRQRHAAVAGALGDVHAERLDELAALIAAHWESAGEQLQAAQWRARAAGWAGLKDPHEALRQWRLACDLADAAPDSPERGQLALATRLALLNLAWRIGVPEGVGREDFERETALVHEQAIALAAASENLTAQTVALAAYGAIRGIGGHLEDMADLGMRAVKLAEDAGDWTLKLNVLPGPTYGLFAMGRYARIVELLEEFEAQLPEDPAAVQGITIVCPYAWLLCWRAVADGQTGALPRAFAGFERALALARVHGDVETESWVQMSVVQSMELAGGGEDAMERARQAHAIAEQMGGAFSLGLAWRYLGIAHLLGAEWREAIAAVEQALATWRTRQVGLEAEPHALTMLARAQLGLGEVDTAAATAHEALALAIARGTKGQEIEARLALAAAMRACGGDELAAALADNLRRARALVVATGARTLQPRIHVELAELARLRGDADGRERELAHAQRLFREVGAVILAERYARSTA